MDGSVNLYIAGTGSTGPGSQLPVRRHHRMFAGEREHLATHRRWRPRHRGEPGNPMGVTADSQGDLFIADAGTTGCRRSPHPRLSQFGISMTAGDTYTIAGSEAGHRRDR